MSNQLSSDKIIEFKEERNFNGVINAMFAFIKQNFKHLGITLLYVAAPIMILAAGFATILPNSLFSPSFYYNSSQIDQLFINMLPWLAGLFIASFVFIIVLFGTIYQYIFLYIEKGPKNFTASDVIQRILSNFVNLLVTTLTIIGIFLILFAGIGFVFYSLFMAFPQGKITIISLGILICLIVSIGLIYISINSVFVWIIRLDRKDISIVGAIRKSFSLVSGSWWQTFGILFIAGIVQNMISYVFMMPSYISSYGNILFGNGSAIMSIQQTIIYTCLYTLGMSLSCAVPTIATAFQYFSLVEQKEGLGLIKRIENFGKDDINPIIDDEDENIY